MLDVATGNRSTIVVDDCSSEFKTWDSVSVLAGRADGNFSAARNFSVGDQNLMDISNPEVDRYRNTLVTLNTSDLNGDHATDLIASNGAILFNIPAVTNRPPTVNAGPDQVLLNDNTVNLRPAASDPDEDMLTYDIRDAAGNFVVTYPNACFESVLTEGKNVVTVTVKDGHGHSASDSVVYTVVSTNGGTGQFAAGNDIGKVAAAGGDSFDDATGAYTVQGSGSDIWGTADEFHYVWTKRDGDFTITTRMDSVQNVNVWDQGGDLVSTIDVCGPNGPRRAAEVGSSVSGIAWTDGGRTLAFLSTTTNVLTPDHVWTVPAAGGAPVDRTPSLTGSATGLTGDAAGRVWVVVARGVQNEISRFENGALTTAYRWPAGSVIGLPVSSDIAGTPDQIAVAVGDPEHGASVAVPTGNALSRITTEADVTTARIDFGAVRVVKWTSKEGIALEGIATFPAGYQEGRRYPFLVLPHGGPEANDLLVLDAFSRIIAGLGYVVLQPEYPWVHRLRRRLSAGHLSALWRSRVPRCRQRYRLCRRAGVGRSAAVGHVRVERRRLHDVVDGHPDQSLSCRHRRGGHHGLGQLHVDE